MKSPSMRSINILLVEDNEDDIFIIRKIFEKANVTNMLNVVRRGEEALDYINHRGKYAEEKPPTPGLVLLDIMMPGLNGFDVLKELKASPKHKKIPVVMLTTSNREEDIVKSFENGACSYITKPISFDRFFEVIKQFKIYWTMVSKIPNGY
ncbi:MAG: response regulator [Candidatus Eremiobacteraeota bacterium]|nr:response regulator [Candidatus Eremiobacteraeota bacterium]